MKMSRKRTVLALTLTTIVTTSLLAFQNCTNDTSIASSDTKSTASSSFSATGTDDTNFPPPLPGTPPPAQTPTATTNVGPANCANGYLHGQNLFAGGQIIGGVACYLAQCLNGQMYCSVVTSEGGNPTQPSVPAQLASCSGAYLYGQNIFTNGASIGGVSCYMAQCLNGSLLCSIPAADGGTPSSSAPGASPSPYKSCSSYLHTQNVFLGGGMVNGTSCYMAQCLNGTLSCSVPTN